MEEWLYAVTTLCKSPEREKEFNAWYDKVHLPDILKVPGFKHATRYKMRVTVEEQGNYLALYEIETEDIDKTMAVEQDFVAKLGEQGRLSDAAVLVSRALYQKISDMSAL